MTMVVYHGQRGYARTAPAAVSFCLTAADNRAKVMNWIDMRAQRL